MGQKKTESCMDHCSLAVLVKFRIYAYTVIMYIHIITTDTSSCWNKSISRPQASAKATKARFSAIQHTAMCPQVLCTIAFGTCVLSEMVE